MVERGLEAIPQGRAVGRARAQTDSVFPAGRLLGCDSAPGVATLTSLCVHFTRASEVPGLSPGFKLVFVTLPAPERMRPTVKTISVGWDIPASSTAAVQQGSPSRKGAFRVLVKLSLTRKVHGGNEVLALEKGWGKAAVVQDGERVLVAGHSRHCELDYKYEKIWLCHGTGPGEMDTAACQVAPTSQ